MKKGKLWSTNKKVIGAHVDLPEVSAFEFGPHDCYKGNFNPLNFPQSDFGCRADSGLVLPQISRVKFVAK